jgi:adenosylcobinamide amidohydrolase
MKLVQDFGMVMQFKSQDDNHERYTDSAEEVGEDVDSLVMWSVEDS